MGVELTPLMLSSLKVAGINGVMIGPGAIADHNEIDSDRRDYMLLTIDSNLLATHNLI